MTYNGVWDVHSAALDRSVMVSTRHSNLVRFELQEGDEWPLDVGRTPPYDRAELGSTQQGLIDGGEETWYSFALRGWGLDVETTTAICQMFSDTAEFMLQQSSQGLTWRTFRPDGTHAAQYVGPRLKNGRPEQFVIRFVSRNDGSGELEAWRDGVHLFNKTGLSYGVDNPTTEKRPKYGLYRERGGPTTILHYANFRVGPDLSGKVTAPDPYPVGWPS